MFESLRESSREIKFETLAFHEFKSSKCREFERVLEFKSSIFREFESLTIRERVRDSKN